MIMNLLADPAINAAVMGALSGAAVILLGLIVKGIKKLVGKTENKLDDAVLEAIEKEIMKRMTHNSDGKKVLLTGEKPEK